MENKGYSVYPHLGPIPNDWHVVNAQDICTKITDGTHDTPSPTKHGIPYIKSVHIKKGSIKFDACLFLCQEDHDIIFKRCNPSKGDLLIVNIGAGNVGHCAYVDVDFEFSMKNIALLKPDPKLINDRYLYHYYKSRQQKVTHRTKTGGAQPFLSLRDLKKLKIVVPPILEQCKITQILSTWDKAISTTESLIANSQQQKKSLMQQLLTGKKWFSGFEGEWKFKGFNDLYKVANNKSTQIKAFDYLDSGTIPIVDQGKSLIAGYTNNSSIYQDLPVIIFGDHTRIIKWINFVFAQGADGTQVLKVSDKLDAKFGYYLLAFIDIPNLGYSRHMRELKEKDFKYPIDKAEQQKIASVLTAADQEIDTLQQKLTHLKQEKKALMQQLLTGKRRVKVDNETEAA